MGTALPALASLIAGRLLIGEKKPVKEYAVTRYVRSLSKTWPARSTAWAWIVFVPAELVSRGSGTVQEAIPEPASAQVACATEPKPYVAFTVTVGSETSIGIGSDP